MLCGLCCLVSLFLYHYCSVVALLTSKVNVPHLTCVLCRHQPALPFFCLGIVITYLTTLYIYIYTHRISAHIGRPKDKATPKI